MNNTTLARPYAEAVFSIANASGLLSEWEYSLSLLAKIVSNQLIQDFIKNQTITANDKAELIIAVCADKIGARCENLIRLMSDKQRLLLMPELVEHFHKLKLQAENTKLVKIISAVELTDKQQKELIDDLEQKFSSKILATFKTDPNILGGMIVKIADKVYDLSLTGKLQELYNVLAA